MAVRRVRSVLLKSSVVDSERVSVMRKGNGCKERRVGKGWKERDEQKLGRARELLISLVPTWARSH